LFCTYYLFRVLRGFAAHVLADQFFGEMLVLAGEVEQLPAPRLMGFALRRVAHLHGQRTVMLCARQVVLHGASTAVEQHPVEDDQEDCANAPHSAVAITI